MWYTVFVTSPQTQHARNLLKDVAPTWNGSGERVLWDGKAKRRDIMDLARSLTKVPDFLRVRVFSGKDVGLQVADLQCEKGGD